ncbi:MAG: LptA/OstA family protein [bacterium]
MIGRGAPLLRAAGLLLAGTLAGPAWGAVLTFTASSLVGDATTGVAVAEGGVRFTDGVIVATGGRLVLDTRRRTATLATGVVRSPDGTLTAQTISARYLGTRVSEVTASGAPSLAMPRGRMSAAEIVLLVAEERLTASGGVRLRAPPDLVATGSRLEYGRRTGEVTMAGPVTLKTARGTIAGTRLTGQADLQRARLTGPVTARFGAINAAADEAALDVPAKTVTLSGTVRIRQGGRLLQASKVTIYYVSGRLVAEGTTHLEIPGEPGAPRP